MKVKFQAFCPHLDCALFLKSARTYNMFHNTV